MRLRTIESAARQSGIDPRLIRAVINRIGTESVEDVYKQGIDGGFSGFIYSADTVKFFKSYRELILDVVNSMAEDLGENPAAMVAGFNCLKIKPGDFDGMAEIYRALGGRLRPDDISVPNALAWFAAEESCRALVIDD